MSFLSKTSTGILPDTQKVVIYAPPGFGKSTFGTFMPRPYYLDVEGSTGQLNVNRLGRDALRTIADVEAAIDEIVSVRPDHIRTIIVDTADWLEALCEAEIVKQANSAKVKTVADIPYGAGAPKLAARFRKTLAHLDAASAAGFHVVLFAHSKISRLELPDASGPFDRYELKMSKGCGPLLKEWCDALLFGNWLTQVSERAEGEAGEKYKAVGGKIRKLYTERTAAFDAKNRHGLDAEEPWDIATIVKAYRHIGADLNAEFPDRRPAVMIPPPKPAGPPPEQMQARGVRTPSPPPVRSAPPGQPPAAAGAPQAAPVAAAPELDAAFAAAIAGREVDVAAYYVAHGELAAGAAASALPPDKKQRIAAAAPQFVARLDKWLEQQRAKEQAAPAVEAAAAEAPASSDPTPSINDAAAVAAEVTKAKEEKAA